MTSHEPTPPDLSPAYNPFDPAQLEDPYPAYAETRRRTPVSYSPQLRAWLITRHEDCNAVLRDATRFSSARGWQMGVTLAPEAAALLDGSGYQTRGWVNSDPPDHTRLRGLVSSVFTPQRIATLEPRLRVLADELIDGFIDDGQADLIRQFAFPFAATLIADILGVPRTRIGEFKAGADHWLALIAGVSDPAQQQAHARGFVEFERFVTALIEERRQSPADDLLSTLIQAHDQDATALSQAELTMLPMHLLLAGHESSMHLIGNALALLLQHPAQLQALRDDPTLIGNVVEEVLRYDPPVPLSARMTTCPVTVSGASIPADARVMVLHGAANHDETRFHEPQHFDIQRPNADQHIALGRGIHVCLGAPLARMEGRIALERLLARLPRLRMAADQPLQHLPMPILRGYRELPLVWDVLTADQPHDERGGPS